ncbi:hypothetical protein [Xenophilus sp.]|uniref:hypothetical protein n=1 Tax=Xenophilus sp. TaxID=1873499 RepID=UPI0037DD931C
MSPTPSGPARRVVQLQEGAPDWDALGVPHLQALVSRILELQSQPSELLGRWYQRDIVASATFEVPSPWTGQPVRANRSVALWDKSVFYGFGGEPDLWLGATSLGEGYPIASIYVPSRDLFVNLGHPVWGAREEQIDAFLRIVAERDLARGWAARAAAPRVVALTGDASFAHGIWNQLSALDHLGKV